MEAKSVFGAGIYGFCLFLCVPRNDSSSSGRLEGLRACISTPICDEATHPPKGAQSQAKGGEDPTRTAVAAPAQNSGAACRLPLPCLGSWLPHLGHRGSDWPLPGEYASGPVPDHYHAAPADPPSNTPATLHHTDAEDQHLFGRSGRGTEAHASNTALGLTLDRLFDACLYCPWSPTQSLLLLPGILYLVSPRESTVEIFHFHQP